MELIIPRQTFCFLPVVTASPSTPHGVVFSIYNSLSALVRQKRFIFSNNICSVNKTKKLINGIFCLLRKRESRCYAGHTFQGGYGIRQLVRTWHCSLHVSRQKSGSAAFSISMACQRRKERRKEGGEKPRQYLDTCNLLEVILNEIHSILKIKRI